MRQTTVRPHPPTPAPGAVSAAHPLAADAGLAVLGAGGNAVDAAIAAQAVLTVVLPQSCGLGGDGLALVAVPGEPVVAVHGAGRSPAEATRTASSGGASVTVPGVVDAWAVLSARWGRLPLADALAPAVQLARDGFVMDDRLARVVDVQRPRLEQGGAQGWSLLGARSGDAVLQPAIAEALARIGRAGPDAYYRGGLAEAIAAAVQAQGGWLSAADLAGHATLLAEPIGVDWDGGRVLVQPPPSQGVLLAMALRWLEAEGPVDDHAAVELVEAVFAFRDRAAEGAALLREPLSVDRERAGGRGGPRSSLHTAGVAAADAHGTVVSSLVSLFDDFGSGVFVPAGGFVLNNRAVGFTAGPNAPRPGSWPVHTLAPALVERAGGVMALSTPGADGQVQTLLQVLRSLRAGAEFERSEAQPAPGLERSEAQRAPGLERSEAQRAPGLEAAIAAPRWRNEGGRLFVERSHPATSELEARGHDVVLLDDGDERFGAVVAAGTVGGDPVAAADWRRSVAARAF